VLRVRPDISEDLLETMKAISEACADALTGCVDREVDDALTHFGGKLHDAYSNGMEASRLRDSASCLEFMCEVACTAAVILTLNAYRARKPADPEGEVIIH
jgi:hypothetical protein